MRVLVTGATGFVGQRLCVVLHHEGHEVIALSRDPEAAKHKIPSLQQAYGWDPETGPPPVEAFAAVSGVVNLAGESVVGRWSESKKQAIRNSRVVGTRHLVRGMAAASTKPRVLVSASAIGFYGDRGEQELTEDSAPGQDFLGLTCQEWEQEAERAAALGVRVVKPRIGIVLGPGGGALEAMLLPFKLGAGGPLGSGRQWWSWVHRDDLVKLIIFALDSNCQGALNATAPHPVRQKDFAKVLGKVLRRPAFMPAPAFALKIVLGGFSTELLSSKRVYPHKTQDAGFRFQFPELHNALADALG